MVGNGGPHLWQRQIICNLMCLKTAGENVNGGGALNVGKSSGEGEPGRTRRTRRARLTGRKKLPSRGPEMFATDENASSVNGLKNEDEWECGDNLPHQIQENSAFFPPFLRTCAARPEPPAAPRTPPQRLNTRVFSLKQRKHERFDLFFFFFFLGH